MEKFKKGGVIMPQGKLDMERNQRLKVFAIGSPNVKIIPSAILEKEESFLMTLAIAYSLEEAMAGGVQSIVASGNNPADYLIGYKTGHLDLDEVINFPLERKKEFRLPPTEEEANGGKKREKSVDELCNAVRYVYGKVGTKAQAASAEKVIQKFLDEEKNLGEAKHASQL